MTMCSIYVGDLNGFSWDGDPNGNIPKAITSAFPPISGKHYHWALEEWAKKTGVFFAASDFDAYVARVTKDQILAFIAESYDSDPSYTDPAHMLTWEGKPYLVEKLNKLREEVAALDPTLEYGLTSECY